MAKPIITNLVQSGRMEAQIIDRDVRCLSCGYNLRGLQSTGQCPECAADVAGSLVHAVLFADHRSLRFAEIGLWLIILLTGWQILFKIAWILLGLGLVTPVQQAAFDIEHPAFLFCVLLAQCAAMFLFCSGNRTQTRRMIFVCLLVLIGLDIVVSLGRWPVRGTDLFLVTGLAIAFNFLWLGRAAAIAAESHGKRLAERLTLLKWTLPPLLALGFFCTILPRSGELTFFQVFCDGAAAALSAWMIYLFTQLNGAIQKLPPPDEELVLDPVPPISPALMRNGSEWIKTVGAGLGMQGILIGVTTAANLFGFVNFPSAIGSRYASGPVATSTTMLAVALALHFLIRAPAILFVWWMTIPPPASPDSTAIMADEVNRRMWLRFITVFAVAGGLLISFDDLRQIAPSDLTQWIVAMMNVCFGFYFYLFIEKELAPLLGNNEIRRWAATLKWLIPAVGAIARELLHYVDLDGGLNRLYYHDLQTARMLVAAATLISGVWLVYYCWREFRRALRALAPRVTVDVI